MADYLAIDLPGALAFQAAGHGHVVANLAASGGDISWSVYYTWGEWPEDRVDPRPGFARALRRGMDWINRASPAELGPLLSAEFPAVEPGLAATVVDLYRTQGMWRSPVIDIAGYDRWQAGIADAHLIASPIPYRSLVDAGPAATGGK
jgi:NitT/TauT family transport system substrate-binding protein